MKKMALTRGDGNIAPETIICEQHYTVDNIQHINTNIAGKAGVTTITWYDVTQYVEGLPCQICIAPPPVAAPAPMAPKVEEKSRSLTEIRLKSKDQKVRLRGYRDEAEEYCEDQIEHYGLHVESIPDNVVHALDRILDAKNDAEAKALAGRVQKKIEMHCLQQWSQRKATGPSNPVTLEKRAKKAESLAAWLRDQGKDENADQQLKRAADLRAQATEMRAVKAQPSTPTQEEADG